MLRVSSFLRNPMSFLFARTATEERLAEYLIREHHRGRRLAEILQDRYVINRTTPQQQARLLERQDVIEAVSRDDLDDARRSISALA